MLGFITRRLLVLIPTFLIIAFITFVLMQMAPGGPWDRDPGRRGLDPTASKRLDVQFGLDKPAMNCVRDLQPFIFDASTCLIAPTETQFFSYMFFTYDKQGEFDPGVVFGDLGPSYRQRGRNVQDILFSVAPGQPWWNSLFGHSVRLGLLALTFAVVVGLPLGILAALKHNTIADYLSLLVATVGVSLPNFVIGILLIIVFGSMLGWIKIASANWSDPASWILPATILGFGTLAFTARLTRASMLEVMRQDYVRTARAKGLAEQAVIWVHMVKNALIPVVTFLGPALAALVTGSFIIETMFGFPGVGRQYVKSISERDYSMIMASTLLYGVLVALANLSVDVIYSFLDPRIRLE